MDAYKIAYDELNDLQRSAVDITDGPLLVLAGPGTGKTQLLSVRAGSILEKTAVGPENILIMTYTNAAAKAMKDRLARIIGKRGYEIEVGTFHSFANSIIQDSEEAANYVGERIQMDDVERVRALEHALDSTNGLDNIRPFRAPYTYLKEILQKISELKKDGITPDRLESYLNDKNGLHSRLEEKYINRLRAFLIIYKVYEDLKGPRSKEIFDDRGRYDFDDMILYATEALKKEASLRDEYGELFRYIMVDEFQDTNGSQLDLLFTLAGNQTPNVCCVGDDDQSIYRFQGASVGNFRLLRQRYPLLKTVSLKDNYRSTEEILAASSSMISLIPKEDRMDVKKLRSYKKYNDKEMLFREFSTEEEELLFIVEKVKELSGKIRHGRAATDKEGRSPYNDIAILVRKRSDILKLVDAFLRAGIPYSTDGKEDVSGEKRVRQLLNVLELANADPFDTGSKDLELYNVLSSDYLGLPQSDILRFIRHVQDERRNAERGNITILGEVLKGGLPDKLSREMSRPELFLAAQRAIGELLRDAPDTPVHSLIMNFIKNTGMYAYILKEYSTRNILRIRELRGMSSFINMIKRSDIAKPGLRLKSLVQELKTRSEHGLGIQGSLVTLSQEGVRIFTAHGSKGLEFHSVIIPFCLQNKNWPARPIAEKIQLPPDIFTARRKADDKESAKKLSSQDEIRLFYVAMTRAKSDLVFTASTKDDHVPSSYLNAINIPKLENPPVAEEGTIEKFFSMTDSKDPFIGTEAVLKDMAANLTLNPTRLNNYMACARKFLYNDILKLPGPKKKSLVFGNCVHKALEMSYADLMKSGKFPPFGFFKKEFLKELTFQGVDEGMEKDCLNKLETLSQWYRSASSDPIVPLGLERKLMITLEGSIIFTGKYDKVEWDDKGKDIVRIIDYKTGKPDEHIKAIDQQTDLASKDCDGYLRQLVCYKLLYEKDMRESKGRKVGRGTLVFIEPVSTDMKRQGLKKGDYVTKSVVITSAMVQEIEDLIKNVWSDISRLGFDKLEARDEKICGFCDFDDICWRRG